MSVTINQLQRGDVIAVHGTSFVSRAIEEITESHYSHVALVTGPNELIEAQGLENVCYRDAGDYLDQADVYRHKDLPPPKAGSIVHYAEQHLGQCYDYMCIAWELLRYMADIQVPFAERHTVICSTLIADAYREAGFKICRNVRFPSPADITKAGFFTNLGPFREVGMMSDG